MQEWAFYSYWIFSQGAKIWWCMYKYTQNHLVAHKTQIWQTSFKQEFQVLKIGGDVYKVSKPKKSQWEITARRDESKVNTNVSWDRRPWICPVNPYQLDQPADEGSPVILHHHTSMICLTIILQTTRIYKTRLDICTYAASVLCSYTHTWQFLGCFPYCLPHQLVRVILYINAHLYIIDMYIYIHTYCIYNYTYPTSQSWMPLVNRPTLEDRFPPASWCCGSAPNLFRKAR